MKLPKTWKEGVLWLFYLTVASHQLFGWVCDFDHRWANTNFWRGINWLMNWFMFIGSMFGCWVLIKVIAGAELTINTEPSCENNPEIKDEKHGS